jgi:hypothetical protein
VNASNHTLNPNFNKNLIDGLLRDNLRILKHDPTKSGGKLGKLLFSSMGKVDGDEISGFHLNRRDEP